jgi:protein-L-isoaspartate(D-aspartate) O-methyltransferase
MEARRAQMVTEQLRPHGITDERVLGVMGDLPREEFLNDPVRRFAYEDRALAIGNGQTISQPLVVAAMTQVLEPSPEQTALEVGTGSGYQAAVLARLFKHVVTIERDPALGERAAGVLRRLGFDNVEVVLGDGREGWPERAPYQAILIAAAATDVPPALVEQLDEGGRLVMPLAFGAEDQELRLLRKQGGRLTSRMLFPVRFVPLL